VWFGFFGTGMIDHTLSIYFHIKKGMDLSQRERIYLQALRGRDEVNGNKIAPCLVMEWPIFHLWVAQSEYIPARLAIRLAAPLAAQQHKIINRAQHDRPWSALVVGLISQRKRETANWMILIKAFVLHLSRINLLFHLFQSALNSEWHKEIFKLMLGYSCNQS